MRHPRAAVILLLLSCGSAHDATATGLSRAMPADPAADVPPEREAAPNASPRLSTSDLTATIPTKVDGYFQVHGSRRVHVQLDRPMYRPGDDVWARAWTVETRRLERDDGQWITAELVDPSGQVVDTRALVANTPLDFQLEADAPGGRWMVRTTLPTGQVDERPFVVASYTPPRIAKTLDFVREGYGPGDRVEALVELTRPDGRPLAVHPVRAMLQAAGEVVDEVELETDETGAVFVSAALPDSLSTADGLLTVFVEDGGLTESISRSVPLVLADVQLGLFPEGGQLVSGLPGRVYFEAENAHGEPVDVAGEVVDDTGAVVATFSSVHDGLGRFALTPEAGRTYTARLTAPAGIDQAVPLPTADRLGCTLRSFDDVRSESAATAVAVRCATEQEVVVAGVFRENAVDAAAVSAGPDADTVVHLGLGAFEKSQGVLRVTVFDGEYNPLAERLVYRGAGRDLQIEVTPDRERYGPRDEVVLAVKTTEPDGTPVPAAVALSVVDDGVLQLADDESGHILSRLYLSPELHEAPDDPAWYFDADEPLAARGLDLVLGTKGHRSFEWTDVWSPPPPPPPVVQNLQQLGYLGALGYVGAGRVGDLEGAAVVELARAQPMRRARMRAAEIPMAAPMPEPMADAGPMAGGEALNLEDPVPVEVQARGGMARPKPVDLFDMDKNVAVPLMKREVAEDECCADDLRRDHRQARRVRVFPKPDYSDGFQGVRTDFRDTVHWEPEVQTSAMGEAEVRFYLSDALTTFRAVAEGLGGGAAGHGEATFASTLPVSVSTRLPAAVSAGDELLLPLTVENSRPAALDAHVEATLDGSLLIAHDTQHDVSLAGGSAETVWVPVTVAEGTGEAAIRLHAEGGGLSDTVERTLQVESPGFPRAFSAAGEMGDEVQLSVRVDEAVQGSLQATITWQPSTVSTLVQGMAGLIQTPGGCFEQTSSTNWPNVAILRYLESHEQDADPRLRVRTGQALDAGYQKLTGYQVDAGGFETWGSGPGKEVLSAFGLLQFADMAEVYPVDDSVLSRDVAYLLDQRDGRGGFRNSGESAHGYGSAPKPVLDGFITYALARTGHVAELDRELEHQAQVAEKTDDPYVLALAARVLHAAGHDAARLARKRLAALQADDGSFPGAESSITRSYEANLLVESTALAALAMMDSPEHRRAADSATDWLIDNRRGVGTWGATQATALALDALTTHAEVNRRPRTAGRLEMEVNGKVVGELEYDADQQDALVLDDWAQHLVPGENSVVLRQPKGEPLPFTVDVAWTSLEPMSDPGAELTLSTELAADSAEMGDTVRLTTTLGNATDDVVPSPIARVGLPAGLEPQTWQLDELQEAGVIAFYELRPREVTLYWDGIHAEETHRVALDLVAAVPGRFTGPASTAYPYYDDDEPVWTAGMAVAIAP